MITVKDTVYGAMIMAQPLQCSLGSFDEHVTVPSPTNPAQFGHIL